jgi:hypothetical protein
MRLSGASLVVAAVLATTITCRDVDGEEDKN